jgi:predicted O-methyltransferase YrrM
MTFTSDWVTPFIPSWEKHVVPVLAHRPGVRWLEVGSFEGRSALWTLDNILQGRGSEITCVDHWAQGPWLQQSAIETRFDENVLGRTNLRKLKGRSDVVLPRLPALHFDGVYVDGSHEEDDVYRDARLCLPLLKPGAFMIFDDYEFEGEPSWVAEPSPPRQFGVNAAVTRLLRELGDDVVVLHRDWQLIARIA